MPLNLRKTGGNALSIFTSDAMNRTTTFLMYALVGRYLGAHEFGQLSLALTLFYIFQVVAAGGLKTLIIRQVTRERAKTRTYFLNGCLIVALCSFSSVVLLYGFVHIMHYAADTSLVVLLLSLGLFPYAISAICEGILQAWEQMNFIAYVNVPVNVGKVICACVLLTKGSGLYAVIWILLGSMVAIALIEIWILLRRLPAPQPEQINLDFCLATFQSTIPFWGIDGTIAVMSSLNILILAKMANETQVGLYNAATQVLVPLLLVYQSIAQSIFPMMCRTVESGFESLKHISEEVMELLLVLALPAVAGVFFFGNWAFSILYKNPAFQQAFPVLRIMSWILVLQVFTTVLGQALLASHREKITLRIVGVDTIVNVLVGFPLISHYGMRGAAYAFLITKVADCLQHYVPVSRLFSGIPLARIVWKPILATTCMTVYLALATNRADILAGVWATLIYGASLLALAIWTSGGPRQFRNKYLPMLSE
jgi:O-antigen/teichoic acid export membrane protein